MELKVTSEKVLEAASKCSDAKNVLATLFPEVFADNSKFVNGKFHGFPLFGDTIKHGSSALIEIRSGDEYNYKSFWLNTAFTWELVQEKNNITLVPKKIGK